MSTHLLQGQPLEILKSKILSIAQNSRPEHYFGIFVTKIICSYSIVLLHSVIEVSCLQVDYHRVVVADPKIRTHIPVPSKDLLERCVRKRDVYIARTNWPGKSKELAVLIQHHQPTLDDVLCQNISPDVSISCCFRVFAVPHQQGSTCIQTY
ncbi:hypothetical protein Zmor_004024 [Zophobas morio]|uniref:Uncharacterized protein n=1 Tax=Zophobas morio TaxID=2755281 RepID=A0AA38HJU2_9CUCU|nr:hypothetical protein Zmor_004024 [Zophobas morio]